jgi:hypothetical protein
VGCGREISLGTIVLGIFAQAGRGTYDSHKRFLDYPDLNAKGDLEHAGGGILTRLDFKETNSHSFYVEMAFYGGQLKTNYRTTQFAPAKGEITHFETQSGYRGAILGSGIIFNLTETSKVEAFLKYMWTKIQADSFTTNFDEVTSLDEVNSLRVKGGIVYSRNILPNLAFSFGGGLDHEFNGTVKGSTYGKPLPISSLKGTNAFWEAGFQFRPYQGCPLSFGLAGRAYLGRRRGGAAFVNLGYTF